MIKKNLFRSLILALILVAGLTACGVGMDPEGEWDPMEWKADVKLKKDHSISVSAEGGTFHFTCTNYSWFWLSWVSEDGQGVEFDYDDHDYDLCVGKWSRVEVKGNVMTVTISPNETGSQRSLKVGPTAGDIFDYFTFTQANQ